MDNDSGKIDPNFIKIFAAISLAALIFIFGGAIFFPGESQAYKDGWNDAWTSLNYPPMSGAESALLCKQASEIYGGEDAKAAEDFHKGCLDWHHSGDKGLNRK